MEWVLGILLRPLFLILLFVLVVAPVSWLLYRIIPPGRLKVTLFKVRTGNVASRRDKVIMTLAVLGSYLILGIALFLINRQP